MTTNRRMVRLLLWGTVGAVTAFVLSVFVPVSRTLALTPGALPANGTSSARLTWALRNVYGQPIPFYPWGTRVSLKNGEDRVRLLGPAEKLSGPALLEVALLAGDRPGVVELLVEEGPDAHVFRLTLVAAEDDRDRDGFPDRAELVAESDRRAFRDWFTAIAESQFYVLDPRWDPIHRDCAGLIRFAYKEALRRHDPAWLGGTRYLHRVSGHDVSRFHYPDVPLLGDRVFRTKPGSYRAGDEEDSVFSASASARVLWEHNTVPVGKQLPRARAGDLLFFRDPEHSPAPMHSMILLDDSDRTGRARVVYHTGDPGRESQGEVRMVTIAELNAHRDDRWHVRHDNPHFLGFYRWKILEGGRP